MKNNFIIAGLIFLLAIIQESFVPNIFSGKVVPNFFLMALAGGIVVFGFTKNWIWVLVAGLIFDLLAYSRVGIHIVFFILVAYALSFFSRRFLIGSRGLGVVAILTVVILITVAENIFLAPISGNPEIIWKIKEVQFFPGVILAESFWNGIAFWIFLFLFNRIKKKIAFSGYAIRSN